MSWQVRTTDYLFYIVVHQNEAGLGILPWGDEEFDAFLVILSGESMSDGISSALIEELVGLNNDWIETIGGGAEYIHDRIDWASVTTGRQSNVGDGSPMTAWHEDITDPADIVDYINEGGHGSCNDKLVVVIGSSEEGKYLRDCLRDRCST